MGFAERRKIFSSALLNWGKQNRRDFPWRHRPTPYQVFVVEFLLKRTTTTAAERVYSEFLVKYPDITSLANGDLYDIERLLKPIGLYKQRSTGIIKAAKYVVANYGGMLPDNLGDLIKIPHVGPYTAGAILSFGYGVCEPVLDSNIRRVITRVFYNTFKGEVPDRELLKILRVIMAKDDPGLFNWNLIDIGSVICSYRYANCIECPLERVCDYNSRVRGIH